MSVRTAEVVVALRARCTVCVRVVDEAHPLVRIVLADLVRREAVPDARIDLRHLRPLDDFDPRRRQRVVRVVREERPRRVVRASAG